MEDQAITGSVGAAELSHEQVEAGAGQGEQRGRANRDNRDRERGAGGQEEGGWARWSDFCCILNLKRIITDIVYVICERATYPIFTKTSPRLVG